jgi:peptidoglycan/LPS O-acetylase OafA/YrhL
VIAHGADTSLHIDGLPSALNHWLETLAAFGMTLFFVWSGFVIHYNYRTLIRERGLSGIGQFLWARFARLYPLFFLILMIDVMLGDRLYDVLAGVNDNFQDTLYALPYFLTLTHSWIYTVIGKNALIYQIGNNVPVTWSISTEWAFYIAYYFASQAPDDHFDRRNGLVGGMGYFGFHII